MSVGPPEGSFELAMMEVSTSQITTYEYPPQPLAYEVSGPPNTQAPPVMTSSSISSSTNPPADTVMAAILALSSQVSNLSSQFSMHLECLENPQHSYSLSVPAALWWPNPTHHTKPNANFQTGLLDPNIHMTTFDAGGGPFRQ